MDELIQKFMELLSTVPIIPIIIAFTFLRRFASKKPSQQTTSRPPRNAVPDDGYGGSWAPTFDHATTNREFQDPSIDPAPSESMFGGEYGTTKFGFDDTEWGSTFEEDKEHDDRPRISRG